jgi:deoxyribonuclease-4
MQLKTLLGAHFSIGGGLYRAFESAIKLNCTAMQIFTKNSQTWKERELNQKEINRFHEFKKKSRIEALASHTSYLINLATPEKEKREKSMNALKQEFIRCAHLSIPYIVLHPGAHMGTGERSAIARLSESINAVFSELPGVSTRLLLETTAGQGTGIGHTFNQLAEIMNQVNAEQHIGVCMDTCHIFAAGYDIRTRKLYEQTMDRFDSDIGLEHLYLIHLNDSKRKLDSRIDRHEHIGEGNLGLNAFAFLMNDPKLSHIPKIIETPKGMLNEMDEINLNRLRSLIKD